MEEQKGRKKHKKKVLAKGFSPLLTDFKLVHTAQILWGILYAKLSKNYTVMEFTQADAQIILFISTVHNNKQTSLTLSILCC